MACDPCRITAVVELRGGPRGPGPLKDRAAPSKHLVWEGTRGPLKGPPEIKFNTWLQHINIIPSTDGDAPSPATCNHAQFLIRRNQRCRLKTIAVHTCVFSSIQITQYIIRLPGITNWQIANSQLNNIKLAGRKVSIYRPSVYKIEFGIVGRKNSPRPWRRRRSS